MTYLLTYPVNIATTIIFVVLVYACAVGLVVFGFELMALWRGRGE